MRRFKSAFSFAIFLCLLCQSGIVSSRAQSPTIRPEPPVGKGVVAIKAARLIDGTGKPAVRNAVVVVTDNTITAVGTATQISIPSGARVIDLGDATLLPGFIDAHTHVIGRILGDPDGM